jgi:hypothetical protein
VAVVVPASMATIVEQAATAAMALSASTFSNYGHPRHHPRIRRQSCHLCSW